MRHVLVTGATGFVGRRLVARLLADGARVSVATRDGPRARALLGGSVGVVEWAAPRAPLDLSGLGDLSHVVNLMGENIGAGRWTRARKRRIRDSRVLGTRALADGLGRAGLRPEAFVSTSAIGYYPARGGGTMDESTPPDGGSFLGGLCVDWEAAAARAPAGRRVTVRTGVVLGGGGGALARLRPVFGLGLGGPAGDGRQMMSWIHLDDLVGVYARAVSDGGMEGAFNATAPRPVSNLEFSRALARALGRPCLLPVPAAVLGLLMGEMSALVLDDQRIVPARLREAGFAFRFPSVEEALADIYPPRGR